MSDIDLDELRDELEDFAVPKKQISRPPREERIIAGFEEIQKFVDDNKREPSNENDGDIFERIYATRLNQIRKQEDCRAL
ncbi:MAG: GIY-YIG nuclease family protein, partial [Gammaproteobacteria bacterium]|nr:GIY-YIG nuclease family protein [Gammaproteobacteria bacterium]